MARRTIIDYLIRNRVQGGEQVKGLSQEFEKLDSSAQNASGGLGGLLGRLPPGVLALGTFAGAVKGAQAAVEAFQKGADLNRQISQFDSLARSIGTTGDALRQTMDKEIGSYLSNAEKAALGTQLLKLEVVDTGQELARVSNIVARSGVDMGTFTNTLIRDSDLLLDNLGISQEKIKRLKQEIREEGFQGDIFDEAVFRALEEQIGILEDGADKGAVSARKLASAWANVKDAVAQNWASFISPLVIELSGQIDASELRKQLNALGIDGATLSKLVLERFGGLAPDAEALVEFYTELLNQIEGLSNARMEDFFADATIEIDQNKLSVNALGDAYFDLQLRMAKTGGAFDATPSKQELEELEAKAKEAEVTARKLADTLAQAQAGAIGRSQSAILSLADAYAILEESSGTWVDVERDNTGEIARLHEQLSADLSDETARAYRDILDTAAEGSAEWLAAYNALQNDLSNSTRQGIVAQVAELQASQGDVISVYTGNWQAAKDAQEKIDEANAAIAESARQMAADTVLALLGVGDGYSDLYLTVQVATGQMSQAQADLLRGFRNNQEAAQELAQSIIDKYGEDFVSRTQNVDDFAAAVAAVADGSATSSEALSGFASAIEGDVSRKLGKAKEDAGILQGILEGFSSTPIKADDSALSDARLTGEEAKNAFLEAFLTEGDISATLGSALSDADIEEEAATLADKLGLTIFDSGSIGSYVTTWTGTISDTALPQFDTLGNDAKTAFLEQFLTINDVVVEPVIRPIFDDSNIPPDFAGDYGNAYRGAP